MAKFNLKLAKSKKWLIIFETAYIRNAIYNLDATLTSHPIISKRYTRAFAKVKSSETHILVEHSPF